MKSDIVYILKNGETSDEIIYSIRSACKNFPYRKIWIYGGKPEGIMPDGYVEYSQQGANKWEKVNNTIKLICQNEDITADFWLFNDDFFVMKKIRKVDYMVGGTLWYRAQKISKKYGGRDTKYSDMLRETARALRAKGYDRLDYALHVPMLINRKKALKVLDEFPFCPMFRSLYGNYCKVGGVLADDVKITDEITTPADMAFISTDDNSFANGAVGKFIRDAFPDKCKYE